MTISDLDKWSTENTHLKPEKQVHSFYLGKKNAKNMYKYKQMIPLRKGELVVWDMRQFHGTFTNTSSQPRIGQFVRYIPEADWSQKLDRFSPNSVYEKYPELRKETETCLKDLGSSFEELCLAGLRRRND